MIFGFGPYHARRGEQPALCPKPKAPNPKPFRTVSCQKGRAAGSLHEGGGCMVCDFEPYHARREEKLALCCFQSICIRPSRHTENGPKSVILCVYCQFSKPRKLVYGETAARIQHKRKETRRNQNNPIRSNPKPIQSHVPSVCPWM
jgi:hypothetical protein